MTDSRFDPKAKARFERSDAPKTQLPRRWEKKASRVGRVLEAGALLLFVSAGAYVIRLNHPVILCFLAVTLFFVALSILARSSVYELVIDAKTMSWGWAGVRARNGTVLHELVKQVRFYKRHNGAGTLELVFKNDRTVGAPDVFTEQPGVSEEIIEAIKAAAPWVEVIEK